MWLRFTPVFISCLLATALMAQKSDDLHKKFGPPFAETYEPGPGLSVAVGYGEDGMACSLGVGKRGSRKWGAGQKYSDWEVAYDLLTKLAPEEDRGVSKFPPGISDRYGPFRRRGPVEVGNCYNSTILDYEKVKVEMREDSCGMGVGDYAIATWKDRNCRVQAHESQLAIGGREPIQYEPQPLLPAGVGPTSEKMRKQLGAPTGERFQLDREVRMSVGYTNDLTPCEAFIELNRKRPQMAENPAVNQAIAFVAPAKDRGDSVLTTSSYGSSKSYLSDFYQNGIAIVRETDLGSQNFLNVYIKWEQRTCAGVGHVIPPGVVGAFDRKLKKWVPTNSHP
jgi:hypothetical protein